MDDDHTPQGISFQAIFNKVQKTKDGGWKLTFEVSRDETTKMSQLSLLDDSILQIGVVPISREAWE